MIRILIVNQGKVLFKYKFYSTYEYPCISICSVVPTGYPCINISSITPMGDLDKYKSALST